MPAPSIDSVANAQLNLYGIVSQRAILDRIVTQSKPFKVQFVPRNLPQLESWISGSFDKTVSTEKSSLAANANDGIVLPQPSNRLD